MCTHGAGRKVNDPDVRVKVKVVSTTERFLFSSKQRTPSQTFGIHSRTSPEVSSCTLKYHLYILERCEIFTFRMVAEFPSAAFTGLRREREFCLRVICNYQK